MISRRQFLLTSTLPLFLPKLGWASEVTVLRSEGVHIKIVPDLPATSLWGFNGNSPGPVLRAKQGGELRVEFENSLPSPTALHWHGVRTANNMDGVPGLTQEAVKAGDGFSYAFGVPDAGTYWYHSHHHSLEQVARGLYGALIVEESNPPKVDHDIVVFVDDWRITEGGELYGNFDNRMDLSHDGRLGNFAKIIPLGNLEAVKTGDRVRLRLINAATDRVFPLEIRGVKGEVIALDGMPLTIGQPLSPLILAPAQRADIIADITQPEITFALVGANGEYPLGAIGTAGERPLSKEPIPTIEPNPYTAPDMENAIRVLVDMQGGMMAAPTTTGEIWALSGHSSTDQAPIISTDLGKTVVFELKNNTVFPHAIHFHGHHLQKVDALGLGPMRDTFLVDADESLEVVGVMDNPGKWLLHCHMLAHQLGGMVTWFEVRA